MKQRRRGNPLTYWLALFSVSSWEEFLTAGSKVVGFNAGKELTAGKLEPGNKLLCYLTGVSAFVGILQVTGKSYKDERRIWKEDVFPVRIPVITNVKLPTPHALQIKSLRDRLSIFKGLKNPNAWSVYVRSAPRKWSTQDGQTIETEIRKKLNALPMLSYEKASSLGDPVKKPQRKNLISKINPNKRKTIVSRIVLKTAVIDSTSERKSIAPKTISSSNRVTGYSINFPIWRTCRPSHVCSRDCYYATGHNTWTSALKRQMTNLDYAKEDPYGFADRVALEYDKLGLTFIRWNGGGDLFPESVLAINYLARVRPDMKIWIVTRKPKEAALIEYSPNVYIQFSLDRSSLRRRDVFESSDKRSSNYFYSYQSARGETPEKEQLTGISVVFFHNYKPLTLKKTSIDKEISCPLNEKADITDTCEKCRRCFNGDATQYREARQPKMG